MAIPYIKIKQDRQCAYNVILKRLHNTIIAVKKAIIFTYFCACEYVCAYAFVRAFV
jgi:hypothetical protein